ncbi:MAG: Swt1 family HEPN domain-containing protein [Caldilineaceae bacterium]|nr:Swt1 family HEPN domain-containing protein [Caldilineaceae bacterium]
MATTNRERVGLALDILKVGLAPFVSREFIARHKESSRQVLERIFSKPQEREQIFGKGKDPNKPFHYMDVAMQLRVMWDAWHDVFGVTLGHAERSLVSELRGFRNEWAHQGSFSGDDTYRVLDSAHRLLTAVSSTKAAEVEKLKMELLRLRFEEQARAQRRRAVAAAESPASSSGLPAWREVASPHPDVASGHYQQAEFAADLWQVHLGEGAAEYSNPAEFFRRTYPTQSLKGLLANGMQRLSGQGGEPVVQLQTNFGGGKTHSMLALYHLFSGARPDALAGIDEIMQTAGVTDLPRVNRVVLVGNRISPGNPVTKPDGTEVRTLWGELAWQLGEAAAGPAEARAAFDRVRADDEQATNPGDRLRQLLIDYGPALILIDEWVAYARQLHDESDLPAGSFETQFTFAQNLSESAKLPPNCLLVISLPASDRPGERTGSDDIEVGGVRGREALMRLGNVVGRVDSSWRPASADESFEIVRRRLFQPTAGAGFTTRDNVARAFVETYRTKPDEFPVGTAEGDYEKRMREAYPIHPEVFERLYSDWSTLPSFQRTRGVLRLMAAVIHTLWESGDRNPLILPASIPLDDGRVQFELTRYLPPNWTPVIERDIDGAGSRPVQLDGAVANLGRHNACRRVARTLFLGSAPMPSAANQGLDERRIKLGCAMPGESVSDFGDALRRLADSSAYLYRDGTRYWYSTQPTVANLAAERAEDLKREPHKVEREIEQRLRADLKAKGEFKHVHLFPESGHDVQDDMEVGLVVLGVTATHTSGAQDSPALRAAREVLESRGTTPRLFRNALVFVAADEARHQDLDQAVRRYLGWRSILDDRDSLDLPPHQVRQAQQQAESADGTVDARIGEAYPWLLAPGQSSPQAQVAWQAIRLRGSGPLAEQASRRLINDEMLVTLMAGSRLRMELDRVPLWRGDHVAVGQLVDDFARYIYLPRLQEPAVLLDAVRDGVSLLTWTHDSFAYGDDYNQGEERYPGLRAGQTLFINETSAGLLVKPDVAQRQMQEEARRDPDPDPAPDTDTGPGPVPGPDPDPVQPSPPPPPKPNRYHGSVKLDPTRAGRDAGQIAEEVIAHLSGLPGARVQLTLEIEADIPTGATNEIVRIVNENSRTLKFDDSGFESE